MPNYTDEIKRRRTFAIISHPDAGKTTLTEKLLLYGGAITLAGSVKGKKTAKHAVSDWMDIEKKRGISVTSSVMQFFYQNECINILDTPGHQDFSEDTYRTLMAADSAVMVIDASKGVERQTKKLFQVCVMRKIPVFTFINKMDREARDPYDLLEEIEDVLGIETYPVNWPIGCGKEFYGIYERDRKAVRSFVANNGQREVGSKCFAPEDTELKQRIGESLYRTLLDDIELLDGAGTEFSLERVRQGKLSPIFFGSALTNFGVEPFLQHFLQMTTSPLPRKSGEHFIDPCSPFFSAFVFKIQANMNKAHRDRIAFLRICSGRFERGMEAYHVQQEKKLKLSQPQQLMAQEREVVEEAFAGDIIGIFDPGVFSIGDTLCSMGHSVKYEGIPTFAPEYFARVSQKDTLKRKQFVKGISQIAQEGAIQIFQEPESGMEEVIVGVVGMLQFDVLEYRLNHEYHVDVRMQSLPFEEIRWIHGASTDVKLLNLTSDTKLVCDLKGNQLLLFTSDWSVQWALEHNDDLILSEFNRNT